MKFCLHLTPTWRPLLLIGCLVIGLGPGSAHGQTSNDEQAAGKSAPVPEGRYSFFDQFSPGNGGPPSLGYDSERRQLVTTQQQSESLQDTPSTSSSISALTLYKEPSSWIVSVLKEMFSDIDWQAIENARVQIEKFIHKVDRIVGSFRQIITKATSGGGLSNAAEIRMDGSQGSYASRWWAGGGGGDKSKQTDTTRVKEMLERVACYVGYVRLMNLSNEALAELDASKVVTNLFSSFESKRNSSMWNWFG